MANTYRLENFLAAICREVSIADIEMQLLQQSAWQSVIEKHFQPQNPAMPDIEQLRQELMHDIGLDRHLALYEVTLDFTLTRRNFASRLWYRLVHPFARSNPQFKLSAPDDNSGNSIRLQISLQRKSAGKWEINNATTEISDHSLEFLG